jgi:hypothetical protein
MGKKYIVSIEVQKYPYSVGTDENKDYCSEKFCRYTLRIGKKILKKAKRLGLYVELVLRLTNGVVPSQAIGLPILRTNTPIVRSIYSDTPKKVPKKVIIAQVINNSPNKIDFTEKQIDQLYDLAVRYRNNAMSREEFILELRGGDIKDWVTAFGIIIGIITLITNMDAFQVPPNTRAILPPHLEWLYGNQQPGYSSSSFLMEKPLSIDHQKYVSLTKEQKRNLSDPRDGFISVESHPNLVVRYGQVKFKTPKHGGVHGLPTDEKGLTAKTEENALALRDSLVNMPTRKDIRWFDNGMYQGGTERGYDSVNIYDIENRVIAVYKKQEDGKYSQFSMTCELSASEEDHLFKSGGNFVTDAVLNNQKALTIINPIIDKKNYDL